MSSAPPPAHPNPNPSPTLTLILRLGLLGLRVAPPALGVLGARVIKQPPVQAEPSEEQRERVEEGAREDEGVDGRVGEQVRRAEGTHLRDVARYREM